VTAQRGPEIDPQDAQPAVGNPNSIGLKYCGEFFLNIFPTDCQKEQKNVIDDFAMFYFFMGVTLLNSSRNNDQS